VNGLLLTVPLCSVWFVSETKVASQPKDAGFTLYKTAHSVCGVHTMLASPESITFAATHHASEGACVKRRYCGTAQKRVLYW